ncbi:MAG: recombinase RecA [Candidatus Saccharimonadales bacterium]
MARASKSSISGLDLEQTIKEIDRAYGEGSIRRLGDQAAENVEVIKSGSLGLDLALGVGGWPRGRIVEIYGPEMSGKTTLSLQAIANLQKEGGVAAIIDAEYALSMDWAHNLGVDVKNLLVSQPNNGEEGLQIVENLIRSNAVGLIVVDSVAALVPKAEVDGEVGDAHVGLQARMMSQAMRKLTPLVGQSNCCLIFINQLRQKIGVMFGNPEVTSGGMALKFYASVRVDVRKQKVITEGDNIVGNDVKVKVVKNKLAAPFREAFFALRYASGIDRTGEIITLARDLDILQMAGGGNYSYGEMALGRGLNNVKALLDKEDELREELIKKIMQASQD